MKLRSRSSFHTVRRLTLVAGGTVAWLVMGSCSTTTTLTPVPPAQQIALPDYAYLPQPSGHSISDARLLFTSAQAPRRETLVHCDADFNTLYSKTKSLDERKQGLQELVSNHPAQYHWCFYSKILDLDKALQKDEYFDQKQNDILSTYRFLVPVARAFLAKYDDSRYLRWAIQDYRRLSDIYFYRKLELSPGMSSQLVNVANAFPQEVSESPHSDTPQDTPEDVLQKYKIGDVAAPAGGANTSAGEDNEAGLGASRVTSARSIPPVDTGADIPPPLASQDDLPPPVAQTPGSASPPEKASGMSSDMASGLDPETARMAEQLARQKKEEAKNDGTSAGASAERYPANVSDGQPPVPDVLPEIPPTSSAPAVDPAPISSPAQGQ